MKKIFLLAAAWFALSSEAAIAHEGSWFALGGSYENLSSGHNLEGFGITAEGGYWYLGNVAYGGYVKHANLGDIGGRAGSGLKMNEFGVFWKAATEAGLYGKLHAGLVFVNAKGDSSGLKVGSNTSLSVGLGGGFLFPLSSGFHIGPEVIYRHLTSGNGGDQISVGGLVAYSF